MKNINFNYFLFPNNIQILRFSLTDILILNVEIIMIYFYYDILLRYYLQFYLHLILLCIIYMYYKKYYKKTNFLLSISVRFHKSDPHLFC